jgi:FkbH-like protein
MRKMQDKELCFTVKPALQWSWMPFDDPAIAISATFTAEALQPGLAFWCGELGFDYTIRFAGYNQLFQELLDPAGLFARNRGGFNVALVRLEDWGEQAGEQARRLAEAVRDSTALFPSPLIVAVCPSGALPAAEQALIDGLAGVASVHTIAADELLALYPVDEVLDPDANELGHVPYTPEFFAALATAVARKIHALATPPFKVIALDCDDTLWAGICGEDGPQNVVMDPPRRALQEFMAERRREGMLLTLASKNNEEDVVETFRAHPEMPLRLEDFAARRIEWRSKGVTLAELAGELDLGLDSFVLVDDSAKECTEAQAGAPEIVALALPREAEEIPEFLRHVWAFDRLRVTEEDRRRPEWYTQQAERKRAQKAAANLEDFVASLDLRVRIEPMRPEQVARVAQLTKRTNQMNTSGVRRSEAEVQGLAAGGFECRTVDVSDRFGSYGLTGVMIFRAAGDALVVDTFLLSCRALGRGVEHRMVARLGEIARKQGLARVEVPFVASPRNRPAAMFLESIAKADGVYRVTADEAAAVEYRVGAAPDLLLPDEAPRPVARRKIDYAAIASELRTPRAVLARIQSAGLRDAPLSAALDPPRTPLERELAELWGRLLNLRAVGVHDNFFELGGHSLLAVQLLSQVRQTYGVDLSLEVVYSGEFTVAELAKAVELKEIQASGGEYQDILAELERLSDEEARALLAEEQDAT